LPKEQILRKVTEQSVGFLQQLLSNLLGIKTKPSSDGKRKREENNSPPKPQKKRRTEGGISEGGDKETTEKQPEDTIKESQNEKRSTDRKPNHWAGSWKTVLAAAKSLKVSQP
jgi:hypothetical protein